MEGCGHVVVYRVFSSEEEPLSNSTPTFTKNTSGEPKSDAKGQGNIRVRKSQLIPSAVTFDALKRRIRANRSTTACMNTEKNTSVCRYTENAECEIRYILKKI